MERPPLQREYWREVLRRQSAANVQRWLTAIEESESAASLVAQDYENILRALESALKDQSNFGMGYKLIQLLHPFVIDYADWDRWLIYLDQAQRLSQELERPDYTASLLVRAGEVLQRMGNLDEAEKAFRSGGEKYRQLGKQSEYAHTLAKQAVLLDLQGQATAAIELCQQALAISENVGDLWGVAQANLNLSNIYRRAKRWDAGLTAVTKAYDCFVILHREKEKTKALMNIVAIAADKGEWEKVDKHSSLLMQQLIQSGDIRTLSQLKNNLGVAAFTQENYETAESFWQEALTLQSQIQEPTELAGLYNNLGMVYTQLKEWTTAHDMLLLAVRARRAPGGCRALYNLADLYEAQQQIAMLEQILQTAVDGLQTISDLPHASILLATMQERLAAVAARPQNKNL